VAEKEGSHLLHRPAVALFTKLRFMYRKLRTKTDKASDTSKQDKCSLEKILAFFLSSAPRSLAYLNVDT
jgi:hypothetical protein